MAYRALVFIFAVLTAIGTGMFLRDAERSAIASAHVWPGIVERRAEDVIEAAQPPTTLHRDVIVVAADDSSSARLGAVSGWGRDIWASGLRRVVAGRPRAVAMDIALDHRTADRPDQTFWRAIAAGNHCTVLGFGYDAGKSRWTPDDAGSLRYLEDDALTNHIVLRDAAATTVWSWPHFVPPLSDFAGTADGMGVFLRETDPDGVLRDARLLYRSRVSQPPGLKGPLAASVRPSRLTGEDVVLPSLAVATAQAAFRLDKSALRITGDRFDLLGVSSDDPVSIPLDAFGRMTIRYGEPGAPNLMSFADVASGNVGPELFRDKVVVFGVTATGDPGADVRHTPGGAMPRVFVTASAISSILARNYIARADDRDVVAVLLLVSVVAGLLLAQSRPLLSAVVGVCLALLYLVIAWAALLIANVLLPVLPPLTVIGVATVLAVAAGFALAQERQPAPLSAPRLRQRGRLGLYDR